MKYRYIRSEDYGPLVYDTGYSGRYLLKLRNKFMPSPSEQKMEVLSLSETLVIAYLIRH